MPTDISLWTRTMVAELIQSSHRNVPVFTNNGNPGTNDVGQALMELDAGANQVENSSGSLVDSIHLVYQNIDVPAFPRTWKKEHLWANSRGVIGNGTDYNDVHAIRPVNSAVHTVRDELWYSECEILEKVDACNIPAQGAANDTCQCNRIFTPPEDSRGSIARIIMYMDLRYDGNEADTLDLVLTDCPFNPTTDMGYLSQMITWSNDYNVTDAETTRNDMVCTNWQGSRNPFVDFQLAELLHSPANLLPEEGRLIHEICEDIPTSAPTFEANDC